MCTAATYKTKDFYFGRTLDYEFSYGEEVVITPRNEPFPFRYMAEMPHHFAVIGMACVAQEYPLYYDAVNEKGLGMAGLNFVGNACYAASPAKGKDNIAVFEFIPWVLGQCATVVGLNACSIINADAGSTASLADRRPGGGHYGRIGSGGAQDL